MGARRRPAPHLPADLPRQSQRERGHLRRPLPGLHGHAPHHAGALDRGGRAHLLPHREDDLPPVPGPRPQGTCFNVVDSQLEFEMYYGANLPRLQAIKSSCDPKNLFRFEQSIPLLTERVPLTASKREEDDSMSAQSSSRTPVPERRTQVPVRPVPAACRPRSAARSRPSTWRVVSTINPILSIHLRFIPRPSLLRECKDGTESGPHS
ncbi:MAG: Berberine and berberine like [Symbiobacteriaceae bacterium]|jgi:hypothetical protein|nr:Berberine and berberine like [Symbiobacteriaceae bacterium]